MTDEERDDLKSTAESIATDAEQLKQVELRKLQADPDAAEAKELAAEADTLADDIRDKARAEKELAQRLADR
jgi:hypothetical protein